jgi:phosphoribosylamine--glycine ligase
MQAAGIEVPPYHEFGSFEEAYRFARKSNEAWVFKPLGDENDKSLTYVSSSPDDLVGWLKHKIETGKVLKGAGILQQKIDVLAEVGVSGWVGPEGFLPDKWQVCFEHKKLMSGEVGPQTGEMGTVCGYAEDDRLADEMLRPMEPILRAIGHRGDFAIGAIIDRSGKAWPCEFTARCGWPTFWIQTASHRGDPAKWMRDLLDGKDSLRVSYDVAIGVVCAQPPFPYNTNPTINTVRNPIFCEAPADQVHPVSVMRRGGEWQTTDSYVLVVTALGKTVERARDKVYRAVEQIHFADMMYRDDIGEKLESPLPALHKAGWAKEIAY